MALTLCVLFVSCPDGGSVIPTPSESEASPLAVPLSRLEDADTVVVGLPIAQRVVLVDPQIGKFATLGRTSGDAPSATAHLGDNRVAVIGTDSGTLVVFDRVSGRVLAQRRIGHSRPDEGDILTDAEFVAWDLVPGPDGRLYLLADTTTPPRGWVLQIDPTTLRITGRVEVGPGQTGGVFDDAGRLWSVGNEYAQAVANSSFSVIDVGSMTAETFPLPGGPQSIAKGPRGHVFVSLYFLNEVVELDASGQIAGRIRGLNTGPWGIDIGDDGMGAVISEGAVGEPGSLNVIDFESMTLERTMDLQDDCRGPREALRIGGRLVVTCLGDSAVAVLDFRTGRLIHRIVLREGLPLGEDSDLPRGLSLVPPAA